MILKYLISLILFCLPHSIHVYSGSDMPENTFALTFDDGPHSTRTLKILNILDRVNVKVTFFVVGDMAKNHEWIVREELARGHRVGCHTMSHPLMTKISKFKWQMEIDECIRTLYKITRQEPVLFRFPYGESSKEMEKYVKDKGMKVILWNIDSLDWKKTPQKELEYLKEGINKQKRGIVLLHDIQESTVEDLPKLLKFFSDRQSRLILIENNI